MCQKFIIPFCKMNMLEKPEVSSGFELNCEAEWRDYDAYDSADLQPLQRDTVPGEGAGL